MAQLVRDFCCLKCCGAAGFWYPYKNIFSLVGELGIQPFTQWTKSAQFSPAGLEVSIQSIAS
jgi:hypothetical protein